MLLRLPWRQISTMPKLLKESEFEYAGRELRWEIRASADDRVYIRVRQQDTWLDRPLALIAADMAAALDVRPPGFPRCSCPFVPPVVFPKNVHSSEWIIVLCDECGEVTSRHRLDSEDPSDDTYPKRDDDA